MNTEIIRINYQELRNNSQTEARCFRLYLDIRIFEFCFTTLKSWNFLSRHWHHFSLGAISCETSRWSLSETCDRSVVFSWFPPPIKLTVTIYNWNIVESGVKHHNPNYRDVKLHSKFIGKGGNQLYTKCDMTKYFFCHNCY